MQARCHLDSVLLLMRQLHHLHACVSTIKVFLQQTAFAANLMPSSHVLHLKARCRAHCPAVVSGAEEWICDMLQKEANL